MVKPLFRALSSTTSALALLSSMAVPVWAEDVVYNGDPAMLQDIPNVGGTPDPVPGSVAPVAATARVKAPALPTTG